MSYGITVKTLDSAGGQQLAGGQSEFLVEGQPVVLLGDPVQGHGDSPHNSPTMVEGSSWLTWNGVPVVREGNKASCGHVTTGRPWFTIGG